MYLIVAYSIESDWHAAAAHSKEILDLIDFKNRPYEIEQVLKIIHQTEHGIFISLIPYAYFMMGQIEIGLKAFELLKLESIHHKLLYEINRPNDEDFNEAYYLYIYRLMARHMCKTQSQSYVMHAATESFLEKAQAVPFELRQKYGFSLKLLQLDEQLKNLEEWVLIPFVTVVGSRFILIPPYKRKQQIILSDSFEIGAIYINEIFSLWVEAIFAIREEGNEGVKKFDKIASDLPQLLYSFMGEWIGNMIKMHGIARNERLIIIPSALIANLPLGLTAISEDNLLLQDYFTLSLAPSLTAINGIRNRLQDINKTALTHVYSSKEQLKHGKLERLAISSFVDEFSVQNIEAIDKESMFEMDELYDNAYLHIQLHGQYHFIYPEKSSLLLNHESEINSEDLVSMAPKQFQRLITFTSCETGAADVYKSTFGTLRNFPTVMILMGALGVIAPLWEVNSRSTCILMIRFYENHFIRKISPPQALKDAQLWISEATVEDIITYIEGHTNRTNSLFSDEADNLIFELEEFDPNIKIFSSPKYWAGFVYYGL